ncbi:MAG: hypothetical protein R3B06_20935 [Kofleriaceae bacterium]
MRMRLAVLALVLVAGLGTAAAYPQFQFTTGASRCGECHVAPGGGGLLTDYGRDEAGDTISGRGDGRLLHGAWTPPAWLALGGDLRFAAGGKQLDGERVTGLAFPMQGDLRVRVAAGPFSLNLTAGVNGAARGRPAGAAPTSYVVSREHFVAFHQPGAAWSVRAGRFFPTLGLRTVDHTAYIRRDLDMYLLQEPYAVEGQVVRGPWEVFVAAFVPNPIPDTGAGRRSTGATAMAERLIADGQGAVAGQVRVAVSDADRRYLVGAVGKRWLEGPKLLLAAELDVQRQAIVGDGFARWQLVGYASATRVMLPGYLIGVGVHRYAPDLTLRGATRNALELEAHAFPWAHVEAQATLRAEATGGDTAHPNWLALAQLHYYL